MAVAVGLVLAAAVNATLASPADAAGNPTLNRSIISAPQVGWTPLSAALDEQAAEQATGRGVVKAAAQGWTSPDQTEVLTVEVMQWASDVDPSHGLQSFIAAVCGYTPSTSSIPGMVGSAEATCSPSTIYAGASITIAAADKGPIMEAVVFVGADPPSASTLATIATRQYAALPGPPLSIVKVTIGAAILLVALLGGSSVVRALRRRTLPAPIDGAATRAVAHAVAYDRSHAPDRQLREASAPEPVLPRFNPRG